MKNKKIQAVFLMLVVSTQLLAQGVIKGHVFQGDSVTSLPGASVYIEGTDKGAATNGYGYYIINKITPGTYKIIVSAIGYVTNKRTVQVTSGDTLYLNFVLQESVAQLPIVTITGGAEGIKDIPGSVYYISPKEIQQFSYTDVNRTLRAIPGVNMQEEDGFGLRPNIGLRGTGVERSSKITVMEDGVLMAPAPYAAPAAYYFPTIGRMQSIEILKGSSQIKYGPYTTGGSINMISTQIPDDFSGRINLLGGSFGGRNLHTYVGNAHKNVAYLVETFQYSSDGFKQLDNGGNTGFDKKDYLAKLRINTDSSARLYQSLTFKIGQVEETSNETYLGLTDDDFILTPFRRYSASQKDNMKTRQQQFSATHYIELSEAITVTTTVYRNEFSRNWYKLDKVKDSTGTEIKLGKVLDNPDEYEDAYNILIGNNSSFYDDALFVKANNRKYYAQGVQSVLQVNFNTKKIKHNVNAGIRLHQDQIDRYQWVDAYVMKNNTMMLTKAGIPGTESNRIETADALAIYIQYQLKYKKLTLTPGVRYENIVVNRIDYGRNDPERIGNEVSTRSNPVDITIPGIGIDYRWNRYISTFAGVHKGFAPPGSKEGTKPEESVNYELGGRFAKNALSGQLVIFFNDYKNLLGTDLSAAGGNGTTDLFNGGEVQTKGLELQVKYNILPNKKNLRLPITLAYTYTDAVFLNDFDSEFEGWGKVSAGDEFPYLAKNQFTGVLGLEYKRWNINISGRYIDAMRTLPGKGVIPDNEKTDAYFIVDMGINYRMHQNISLFANAVNITDQIYVASRRPVGLRPGMPRAINVGVKAVF